MVVKLLLQWGHALSGMDTSDKCLPMLVGLSASMGPCPFRHGYSAQIRLKSHALEGFNGAMPFQAWIPFVVWLEDLNPEVASMGPCPFRHGYAGLTEQIRCAMLASMGPCPFRHGYADVAPALLIDLMSLQWGHALSGMDTA